MCPPKPLIKLYLLVQAAPCVVVEAAAADGTETQAHLTVYQGWVQPLHYVYKTDTL